MNLFELNASLDLNISDYTSKISSASTLAEGLNSSFSSLDSAAGNTESALSDIGKTADYTGDYFDDLGDAADDTGDEIDDLGDYADDASGDVDDLGDEIDDAGNNAKDADGKFTVWKATLAGLAAQAITQVIDKIKELAKEIVELGVETDTAFAKLETISGAENIDSLTSSLRDLSLETGVSQSELANVAYNAISAGTAVEDAAEMAEYATKLATAGFTDADSALSVLTTAINSYGDEAGTAAEISDSLIQVQNLGVTTIGDLSTSMGRAISTASAYGVNLGNVEAAYVSLTKAGISTEESTTYLSSMLNELGDTGSTVGTILQENTGKSFSELMEDGYSLSDVLQILYDDCDGDSTALMNLWSSAEAGKASNAIVNQGLEEFNENLETIQGSSGSTEEAYSTMADTMEVKMNKMTAGFQDLGLQIYNGLEGPLGTAIDFITNTVIPGLSAAITAIGEFVSWITGIGSQIYELVSGAWSGLQEWVSGVFETVDQTITDFVTNVDQAINDLPQTISTALSNALSTVTTWASNMISQARQAAAQFVSGVISGISSLPSKIASTLSQALSRVTSWGSQMISKAKTSASQFVSGLISGISQLPSKIASTLSQVISRVTSWGSQMVSQFKSIGRNVISGLISGITSMVSSLYSSIYNALSGLVSKAKSALGISSPSKVFREEIGKFIPLGLAEGVERYASFASDAVAEMADSLTNSANAALADFGSIPTAEISTISSGSATQAGTQPVSYTQNFYSPKSLTRREIRRETRNLVRELKTV